MKLGTCKLASVSVVQPVICLRLNCEYSGLCMAILGKGPWPKFGNKDTLNIKIGKNEGHRT